MKYRMLVLGQVEPQEFDSASLLRDFELEFFEAFYEEHHENCAYSFQHICVALHLLYLGFAHDEFRDAPYADKLHVAYALFAHLLNRDIGEQTDGGRHGYLMEMMLADPRGPERIYVPALKSAADSILSKYFDIASRSSAVVSVANDVLRIFPLYCEDHTAGILCDVEVFVRRSLLLTAELNLHTYYFKSMFPLMKQLWTHRYDVSTKPDIRHTHKVTEQIMVLQAQIAEANMKIKALRDQCSHPAQMLHVDFKADTGNYDPSEDRREKIETCHACGLRMIYVARRSGFSSEYKLESTSHVSLPVEA